MRILAITYSLTSGGAERFVVDLCNLLADRGEDVCLVATDDDAKGSNGFYLPDVSPKVSYINLHAKSGHALRALVGIEKCIRRYRPHVVHANTDLIQLLLPVLLNHDIRFYHTIHSVADFYLPGKIWKPLFRQVYSRKVRAITISHTCSESFRSLYRLDNDIMIENGRLRPQLSEDARFIRDELQRFKADDVLFIHIARYSAEKNQKVLFDAMLMVDGAKLLVLGEGYPESIIKGLNSERIMFAGARRNIGDYLACSDFFVLSSAFEGLPLTLLESMSMGVIPVSTPAGGVVDVIKDGVNGFLTEGFDAASLADAMKRAMKGSVSPEVVKSDFEARFSMFDCADKYRRAFSDGGKDLFILSCWSDDREHTWSGTNWGLYKALSKKTSVVDVNIGAVKPSLYERVRRKIKAPLPPDIGLRQIHRQQLWLNGKKLAGNVLQYAEIVGDTEVANTYIYQDLSVDYVSYMSKNLPEVFAHSNYQDIPLRYIEERKEKQNDYYLNHCSGIFTMGQWLKSDLVNRTGINPEIVHAVGGGINLDAGLIGDSHKERRRVLFVGRDFERKGGPVTIDAFRLLLNHLPDAELYVAGPSQDPLEGKELQGYHFMGECSHEELSRLFNLCDIFCMPSLFEAYGLVFIEALCYGLPCIGRNRYEMPYFIEDGVTGKLLVNNDAEELCNCMMTLLKEESYFENVKSRRQFYLKEYSWDTVADRILSIIQS